MSKVYITHVKLIKLAEKVVERCAKCGGSGREFETIEDDTPCSQCGEIRKILAEIHLKVSSA